MESVELLRIALRVLNAVAAYHETPAPEEVRVLRDAAPDRAGDPIDELARFIINRETERMKAERAKRSKATEA